MNLDHNSGGGQQQQLLSPIIAKALGDKLYEKRKAAALEVERLCRNNPSCIAVLVSQLTREFIQSTHPNARNGGLIALAAVALGASTSAAATTTTAAATTATTTTSTATTTPTPTPTPTATGAGGNHLHSAAESSLQQSSLAAASATTAPLVLLLPPILSCLADVDAKVRYYACEAAYNVIKVGRRVALVFFNELLDSLAKLAADPEPSVRNGAELLDRLIKDIVCDQASYYPPELITSTLLLSSSSTTASSLSSSSNAMDLLRSLQISAPTPDPYQLVGTIKMTSNEPPRATSESVSPPLHSFPLPHSSTSILVPGTTPILPPTTPFSFSLPRFIPLLRDRIRTINPATRMFFVQWISVLATVPDLELLSYLPEFLDGLFTYLSDPNTDVRVATANILDEFLKDIKRVTLLQQRQQQLHQQQLFERKQKQEIAVPTITTDSSCKSELVPENIQTTPDETLPVSNGDPLTSPSPPPPPIPEKEQSSTTTTTTTTTTQPSASSSINQQAQQEHPIKFKLPPSINPSQPYTYGQGILLDFGKMIDILAPHLLLVPPSTSSSSSSNNNHIADQELTRATAMRWINDFILLARTLILPYTSVILNAVLPCLAGSFGLSSVVPATAAASSSSSTAAAAAGGGGGGKSGVAGSSNTSGVGSGGAIRAIAHEANANLFALVADTPTRILVGGGSSNETTGVEEEEGVEEDPIIQPHRRFDLQTTIDTLAFQFQDVRHVETRIASVDWLTMLHKKSPLDSIRIDDAIFSSLLCALSDDSEEVVKRDLMLLSQISQSSTEDVFYTFLSMLLSVLSTDRRLLETRGSLIIRHLCVTLHPERIYGSLAEILERDVDDLDFCSVMVQNLMVILMTAPELTDLRKKLKHLETREAQILFSVLYRSFCHSAVSAFTLCLLSQAYEHAFYLLQIFGAELEITVSFLVQVDKLVQLIESPVFTYLRLQLLEPDRHPYLLKCMYGILMLLPQSSAFTTLRNRLNSVSGSVLSVFAVHPLYGGGGVGGGQQSQQTQGTTATSKRKSASTAITSSSFSSASASPTDHGLRWPDLLNHFRLVQLQHEQYRKSGRHSTGFPMSQASRQRVHRNAQYYDDPGSIVTSEIASAESKRFSKASAATTTTTSSSIVSYPLTASQGDVSGGIGQGGSSYSNNGNRMGTSRRNSNSGMSSSAAAAASVNAASSMPSAGTTPPPPPHPASLNATKSSSNVAKDIKKMFTGRGK